MSKAPRESGGKPAVMHRCDLCGNQHQMGPDHYDGEFLSQYQMQVCLRCLRGYSNGVPRAFESRLIAHLKKHVIALPKRNRKGLYPLDRVE